MPVWVADAAIFIDLLTEIRNYLLNGFIKTVNTLPDHRPSLKFFKTAEGPLKLKKRRKSTNAFSGKLHNFAA